MKVQSAYLQNQIPENFRQVKRPDTGGAQHFEKLVEHHKSVGSQKAAKTPVELKLSEVTRRVLSLKEQEAILSSFQHVDRKITRTYTPQGKSVNMEVLLGKQVDVKG